MKKGILLSVLAVILVGAVIYAIWYINERGRVDSYSKDSFIPYNSAIVIHVNPHASLSPGVSEAFATDIREYNSRLLVRVADTLAKGIFVKPVPRTVAMRVEGNKELVSLYMMENKEVVSRHEIVDFLQSAFKDDTASVRKYDRHKIYSLKDSVEEMWYAVSDGMILLSDSELYIEDALKQFERAESEQAEKPRYTNVGKYFSAGAGINIFVNSACFSDVLPLFIEMKKISDKLDITKWFKWVALDGEMNESGVGFNGFIQYAGMEASYLKTLAGQQPRESVIEGIIPQHVASFSILNLSDLKGYLQALELYRYSAGLKEVVRKRKQTYTGIFGADVETELKELLQGEFAIATMAFDEAKGEKDGVVIAYLKSGGLCKALIGKMLSSYARADKTDADKYRRIFQVDRDKSFTYYKFPMDDLAAVYWGYIFDGIASRYVLVEDNYLVFASSENAVKSFLKDYVHRSSIKDTDWYKNLKTKLSAKYNLACFAEVASAMPFYKHMAKDDLRDYLAKNSDRLSVFSAWAMQWSNEGNMLYNGIYLSTEKFRGAQQPAVLWQTKLDAPVSMKPVPVENHVTGEWELLVQDDNQTVYLLNDAGRILWKLPVEGKINSEVYQVDVFKNGKLQYLFSTPFKMYVIDRNGTQVQRSPITLKAGCEMGITLFDYDNDRNYRIFAPCDDRQVYLYEADGTLVKGWESGKADKEIVSKVYHYRVGNKDYIVYADRYRLYILDRKGKERVRVSDVFDLKDHTPVYLTRKGGIPLMAFTNVTGPVNLVGFDGNLQTVKCGTVSPEHLLNVGDVNRDGVDDFIFTDGEKLSVYSQSGQLMFEKILDAHSLDFPYIYKFSNDDIRIGLLDKEQEHLLLISPKGVLSKGFPINGSSPFSIVFAPTGDFYLFAGADNGTVIKYRVQR